jgi:hypothetical protein
VEHAEEQLGRGRMLIVEVDAYHLPDVAGTSYRTEHVKTSIALHAIDRARRSLGYFHNAGAYELEGDDFASVLGLSEDGGAPHALPPYVELVKLDQLKQLEPGALRTNARELLALHLGRRPALNPFAVYGADLDRQLGWLRGGDLARFHEYSFSTMRQCGAAFELTGTFLRWLDAHDDLLAAAATEFEAIGGAAKAMQFKLARQVSTGRPVDVAPMVQGMADRWAAAMAALDARQAERAA